MTPVRRSAQLDATSTDAQRSPPIVAHRAHREVRASWESRLTDLHLSSPQASLLRAVAEQPGTGLRELARKLHTDPMNAKRIADGLEAAGLLCSCDDPTDKRRRVLGPTDAGRALSTEVARRGRNWSATLECLLGSEDADDLRRILARLEAGVSGLLERTAHGDETNRA